ncbi:MAG: ComF family protein [Deltaproteobacteria bacterium]|nr:ComF family protein [Deltaproteobacteria bacterium]
MDQNSRDLYRSDGSGNEPIVDQLSAEITAYQPDFIIPVPLHRKRLRERGYNQSLLLARQLGKALDIDVLPQVMIRTRPTSPQSLLNASKRHKNLHGAFKINHNLPPQRLILVDDIVTTTSTARACSELLSHHGHTVAVIALGRASLK